MVNSLGTAHPEAKIELTLLTTKRVPWKPGLIPNNVEFFSPNTSYNSLWRWNPSSGGSVEDFINVAGINLINPEENVAYWNQYIGYPVQLTYQGSSTETIRGWLVEAIIQRTGEFPEAFIRLLDDGGRAISIPNNAGIPNNALPTILAAGNFTPPEQARLNETSTTDATFNVMTHTINPRDVYTVGGRDILTPGEEIYAGTMTTDLPLNTDSSVQNGEMTVTFKQNTESSFNVTSLQFITPNKYFVQFVNRERG